jgi:hypothetical protein
VKKKNTVKKIFSITNGNLLIKGVQATGEAFSPQKRTSSTSGSTTLREAMLVPYYVFSVVD